MTSSSGSTRRVLMKKKLTAFEEVSISRWRRLRVPAWLQDQNEKMEASFQRRGEWKDKDYLWDQLARAEGRVWEPVEQWGGQHSHRARWQDSWLLNVQLQVQFGIHVQWTQIIWKNAFFVFKDDCFKEEKHQEAWILERRRRNQDSNGDC